MTDDLKDTIAPKSDQLNADDLMCGPITVTVESVKRGDKDQPVHIGIDGGRQPYKPCKSMRRVLIAAWGSDPKPWIGRRMTLFCDPSVMFGGVKVGGIRISHLSHIDEDKALMLTTTRSKRSEYLVKKLSDEQYPADKFAKVLEAGAKAIAEGKETAASIISKCSAKWALSDEQISQINDLEKQ